MWARREERRRRFAATCEGLEERSLLSMAALGLPASANHAAEVHSAAKPKRALVLHGKVTGLIEAIQTNLPLSVNTVIEATGTTQGLPGTVVFEASQETVENTAKTRVTVSNGTGYVTPLSALYGSQMVVSYKGVTPVGKQGLQLLRIHGSVTGGTGAYAGVTSGAFSGVATVNPNTGAFSMKFTLTVKPVG